MRDKGEVGANLYVEDSPENISDLRDKGKEVIILSNATNLHLGESCRARNWADAEAMIRDQYYAWLDQEGLARPPDRGIEPEWAKSGPRPAV